MRAVGTLVRAAILRRRLHTAVIALVVLLSAATAVIGIGLFLESEAPFDHAFARLHGAHLAVTYDGGAVTGEQVRSTAGRPGVTGSAGPFVQPTVQLTATTSQAFPLKPAAIAGRSDPGGPVDTISLDGGRWVQRPGEIVISRYDSSRNHGSELGDHLVATTPSGPVNLLVVGIGYSVTNSADGWVTPAQAAGLAPPGAPLQMLYRFQDAQDTSQVRADLTAVTSGMPAGAVLGSSTYLQAQQQATAFAALLTPVLLSIGALGLVLSVLIVANVVSGAVVAGFRTIGIIKTLGLSPAQVSSTYVAQILLPGLAGALGGLVAGNLVAAPLLDSTAKAYDVPMTVSVPVWVDLVTLLGLAVIVGTAALLPALRAGAMPAVRAISTGRAPRTGRGYLVQRLLARTRLPSVVSLGLAGPFARPARTAMTVVAILLGTAGATLGVGLAATTDHLAQGETRTQAVPITVGPPSTGPAGAAYRPGTTPVDSTAAEATLRAQPGTAHVVGEATATATIPGLTHTTDVAAYDGDASWTGYPIVDGRWFDSTGEAVASTHLLRATGTSIGDRLALTVNGRSASVLIVGEVFDPNSGGFNVVTDTATLTRWEPIPSSRVISVQLTAGTDPGAYARRLRALPSLAQYHVSDTTGQQQDSVLAVVPGLVAALTLVIAIVAALGVFNTVVLNTRERARDIGILRSLGMTPGQTGAMVVASMAGPGLVGAVLGIPAGVTLHHWLVPIMANAVEARLPTDYLMVYRWPAYLVLVAIGVAITVVGTLIPANWAARARTAQVLPTE